MGLYLLGNDVKPESVGKTARVAPKFKVGDIMRTREEAEMGVNSGLPFVVAVTDTHYLCNSERIPIAEQDGYEYPTRNVD